MRIPAFLAVTILFAPPLAAHDLQTRQSQSVVPIPDYALPYGEASAATALQAVKALLTHFDKAETAKFVFAFDAENRTTWSNLPAAMVERAGISVADMSEDQRSSLFVFLASSLSKDGYERVADIMAAEAFLSQDARADRFQWSPENYWFAIYGSPSSQEAWAWQFGGHHLGLNVSILGNEIKSLSPSFVGTEPAIFTLDGTNFEVGYDMHQAGYAVFNALNTGQQSQAASGSVPENVLTGPGKDGVVPPVIGLEASAMSPDQKDLLTSAIRQWVSILPKADAERRMTELTAELDSISFAWTGTDEINTPAYMRIQGPSLIIELLSTGENVGGNASGAGHYHTMYRNPKTDYGR
ncbi:DUF3500 domain-containing protein [Roseibium sp. MMSF_3412]|uniref:DUF3500 domain-containing protein n=1 Tax=Roseibium sp. MMSF_3412 TaxID=3046712 RepID=UPI00273E2D88|nr:DUF3500 domain-containing protein [Roseibium sp. MMSF_3412]